MSSCVAWEGCIGQKGAGQQVMVLEAIDSGWLCLGTRHVEHIAQPWFDNMLIPLQESHDNNVHQFEARLGLAASNVVALL